MLLVIGVLQETLKDLEILFNKLLMRDALVDLRVTAKTIYYRYSLTQNFSKVKTVLLLMKLSPFSWQV